MKTLTEDKNFTFATPVNADVKHYIKKCLYGLSYIPEKIKLNTIKPSKIENKKYKVSVCAIFKNEAPYLREWIEFHKIIGINHFYLYNNNSTDNYQEILKPYVDENIVTLIQWPKVHAQMESYDHCIKNYKDETEWIAFIDLDEFIVPNSTDTIYDFLKPFQKNRGTVLAYFKMFGSSGLVERDINSPVTKDFTQCYQKSLNIGKLFYNTAYNLDFSYPKNDSMHQMYANYNGKTLVPVNCFDKITTMGINKINKKYLVNGKYPIQINHYVTKSLNEYKARLSKGDAFFKLEVKTDLFNQHDRLSNFTDDSINRFLPELYKRLGSE